MTMACSEGDLPSPVQNPAPAPAPTPGSGPVAPVAPVIVRTASRLKRTFTLPRNPFGVRRTQRDSETLAVDIELAGEDRQTQVQVQTQDSDTAEHCRRLLRRPSWRKFITKLAHHVTNKRVDRKEQRSPIIRQSWTGQNTPGATGLRNHGNTCFMNAVLQCLSHTDIIAEYFVLDQYKIDLSRRNKLNSKKFGTRGELTEQLALVLKALWACQYYPELSTGFKAVVERHGSQYRGSSQHDAQEFLLWLLDKVHEDLNTATKKKYKTIKNSIGRPDEVVAAETLANHIRCNSSFVQAVFQAQFRSSLACPRCHRQSNTFDPFHCISVQLPHIADHPLLITVVYVNQQPRCVKLGVRVSASAAVRELRALLTNDTGIPSEDIILIEVSENGFARTLSDCQPIWGSGSPSDESNEKTTLYCIESPRLTSTTPSEPTSPYVLLLWMNLLVDGDSAERFGSPYVMQVSRETGYDDLQKLLLKEMASIVAPGILTEKQEPGEFKIRVVDLAANNDDPNYYLQPELEHPLFIDAVEQALALCGEKSGPPHVKLLLEWNKPLREKLLSDFTEACEQHSSVSEVMQDNNSGTRLSLADCLTHYTRAETLAVEDAWRCPQCQQYLPVVKTLGLWSLPDILVIHLKRFRQQQVKGRNSTKLTTMVDFPLYGFDMTPHLVNKDGLPANSTLLGGAGWSPWKRPRKISVSNDNTYDLYAVCYHHGNDLETGHYTAACRNPYDQQWYMFDDTKVTLIPHEEVNAELINNSAYILFYQRRHGNFVGSSSNSSSAASTSSNGSNIDHWVSRMPKFTYQPKKDTLKKAENPEKNTTATVNCEDKTIKGDEIELDNKSQIRGSCMSLQDVTNTDELNNLELKIDEKNLRNSISLSDNLKTSLANIAVPEDVSDLKSDILANYDKLINKNSLFTMGESRRNTLSEYRNTADEFAKSQSGSSTIQRNSISLTVDPYSNFKDIHVNPKMTISKISKDVETNPSSPPKERKVEECKASIVKVSVFENALSNVNTTTWYRSDKTYNSLRHCRDDINMDIRSQHAGNDTTASRHDWISPGSLRREAIYSNE